jgi:DNA-binding transcriptional ArsR family regulator
MAPRASDPTEPGRNDRRPTAGHRTDTRSTNPSLTELYAILSSARRREFLRYLADYPDPVSVGELAATMASHGTTTGAETFESGNQARLRATLEHVDLPLLLEANIVEFDPGSNAVARGDGFYHVAPFLDFVE